MSTRIVKWRRSW